MIDDVFLERVARLVHEVDVHGRVVGVHLAAALVDRHEHRFDARRGLGHQAGGARGGDGQAGDVAPAIFCHEFVEFGVGFAQAVDEGVVLFALRVVDFKGSALLGHLHRRAVGLQGHGLVHFHGKVGGFLRAISQSERGQHVAFGRDAHAGAASLSALFVDLLPKVAFCAFHFFRFRVGVDFLHDQFDFLQFQVDDVVHQALGQLHVFLEEVEVEVSFGCERVDHIGVEVDGQQAAAVVGAEWNFAAGVRADGAEAKVGIAVGHGLAQDGVPEQYAGLGALPGIVHDFAPQLAGADGFRHPRRRAVDRVLLHVGLVLDGVLHELVVNLDRHVGARHLALGHFGVDERFSVGVLDAH